MFTSSQMMSVALQSAAPWVGSASPNPTVGAAAFDEHGELLASAAHTTFGQLHAEAKVFDLCVRNGTYNAIHTLAVTLEPCTHHGNTPPCTNSILKTGLKNILIGILDPNPMAKGGAELLRSAGKNVQSGLLSRECLHQMAGFVTRQLSAKPFLILKIALNEQGSMIPPIGQKTFTSIETLKLSHRLRKRSDAILTGAGTVLTDQPLFTVRHVPDFSDKKRFLMVMDRRGRLDIDDMTPYLDLGFNTMTSDSLDMGIHDLVAAGCNCILIEAGPSLCRELVEKDLWDVMVLIKKNSNAPDTLYTGRNPSKALLTGLDPFDLNIFLPHEPDETYFAAQNVSHPADTLWQLSNLRL